MPRCYDYSLRHGGVSDEEKMGILYKDIHAYIRFGTCGDAEIDARIRAKEAASAHKRNKPPVIDPFAEKA